jgi:CheY-like chemotaxis protein
MVRVAVVSCYPQFPRWSSSAEACCTFTGDDALLLLQGNYVPMITASPAEAVEVNTTVDVMFLDIRMPGKSGLDVIREAPRPLLFPVVAMTGNVDRDSVAEYRQV